MSATNTTARRIKVGLFVSFGLALLIGAIYMLGGSQNLFNPSIKLHSRFSNVSGLEEGASIRFSGINVGTVQEINIISSHEVDVVLSVNKKIQQYLHQDAKAVIGSEGLMGNTLVNLDPGTNTLPGIADGQYVKSVQPASFDELLATVQKAGTQASELIGNMTSISTRLKNGQGTVGKLLTEDGLYDNLNASMLQINQSTKSFNGILTQTGGAMNLVKTNIEQGKGALGRLVNDPAMSRKLDTIATNLATTTGNLSSATHRLDENLEALKYNFLFRKYFERNGYFDSIEKNQKKSETNVQMLKKKKKKGLFK